MARCETCGNEYSGTFGVNLAGELHTFDCFECAIHLLAPECAHCGCKVIGHGVESNGVNLLLRPLCDSRRGSKRGSGVMPGLS